MSNSKEGFAATIERFSGFADDYNCHRPTPPQALAALLAQIAQCPKPSIADSSHNDQMFRTAKGAEAFAVFDNARRQTFANSWKLLEFCGGRCVDIDKLRVCLIGKSSNLWRIARLLIVRLWTNRLR